MCNQIIPGVGSWQPKGHKREREKKTLIALADARAHITSLYSKKGFSHSEVRQRDGETLYYVGNALIGKINREGNYVKFIVPDECSHS
jgi:hypothetical protein